MSKFLKERKIRLSLKLFFITKSVWKRFEFLYKNGINTCNLRQPEKGEQLCSSQPLVSFFESEFSEHVFLQCSDENLAYIILTAGVTVMLKM
ncbi:hypothetical protein E0I26_06570 [Flavobacterium rhamnosiphilum]|uniref:Uncharacterized protein n=1 Tax=Flavobacterium rhamnosiphilum TaxID=2541724 RepID=A0A4R5F951_9FLAO|nr:hypothetical protein E0I26_06570 [Flavobacterium rhamnosiphilum]